MEENTSSQSEVTNSSANKVILPIIFVLLLLVGVAVFAMKKPNTDPIKNQGSENQTQVTPAIVSYRDGSYEVTGNYVSPGGEETIGVKLVLKDGVITEAEVTPQATRPKSVLMQKLFTDGFKEMVIGKNINEVKLDRVSGSSLTPKGFNDAVEKIKAESKV